MIDDSRGVENLIRPIQSFLLADAIKRVRGERTADGVSPRSLRVLLNSARVNTFLRAGNDNLEHV